MTKMKTWYDRKTHVCTRSLVHAHDCKVHVQGFRWSRMEFEKSILMIWANFWVNYLQLYMNYYVFRRLRAAKLKVNAVKSDFGQAHVSYLGHTVGHG